jgi:O-antigen/teichoic acid export membrane protein
MLVSLYTVRIVLNTLGTTDYGIYNVVGGIVTMFSFLSGTMGSASQRFFAFELGKKDYVRLKQIFGLTFLIYIGIAILILLLAETIGLWFLNTQMNIPLGRMEVANWVYQFSVFSFIMTVITIPYNASIIAHENMKMYAYVGIIEVILKLIVAYMLGQFLFDKLKLYAVLTFFTTLIITFIYYTYCKKRYKECSFNFYLDYSDRKLIGSLILYSGWNIIGSIAMILKNQGINILLNIFYGPVVNTARAISSQIYGVLVQFVTNLYSSSKPQITKYYAQSDMESMWKLVFSSTKFSYFLFMIMSIPFFFEIEFILKLWLNNIPQYTPWITRLILIGFMLEALSNQLITTLQAANKLKEFQLYSVSILLLNLPISFILLKIGASPYIPFVISIIITIIYMIPQVIITKKEVNLPTKLYLKEILKLLLVTLLSVIAPYFLYKIMDSGIIRLITVVIISLFSSIIFIWNIGLDSQEKIVITNFSKKRIYNFLKNK